MNEAPRPVEPHPVLTQYYPDHARRPAFVRGLFDRTAGYYDRVNQVLSWGSGGWYRRHALLKAGLRPGMSLLDVATGTGLVARQAVEVLGDEEAVWGLDVSHGMLAQARRELRIRLVQGSAERLPIADASFDFLSMGYALRHLADLDASFREFHRVLRPNGVFLLLEIGRPRSRLHHALLNLYLGRLIPLLSRLTTGNRDMQTLMRYYWDTIEHCVPAQTILETLDRAGFTETRCEIELGMFRAYSGRKA